jgi:hypothetical protein
MLDGLEAAIADAAIPGFPDDAGTAGPATRRRGQEGTLLAALQPVAADRSALHLALTAAPGLAVAARLRVARWAEGFRRACEASPA